jgi:adenylate cyclase
MKRSLSATFFIGAIAGGLVIALQKYGLMDRPETLLGRSILASPLPDEHLFLGNFIFVVGIGLAVAWTMLEVREAGRRVGLLLLLIVELAGASWILGLAGISFQPVPGIAVALVATLLALLFGFLAGGHRRRARARFFTGRLAEDGVARLTERGAPDLSEPRNYEVTFVYCEVGNQAVLIDEMPTADYARLSDDLIAEASGPFLREGGYLHAADGEGIRAIFGFPNAIENHAAAAAKAALKFRARVAAASAHKPESLGKIDLRIGISSGLVVASMQESARGGEVLVSGEPVELARRVAAANPIYGSQILLGPRTFSEAGAEIVARPIDFLRSGEAHERLEVYELRALASEASAEELACRDSFWTGLVYFRERRWTEAFAEFSRARPTGVESDEPLQRYLRRLEPIMLQVATEPAPVAEPLSPF